MWPRDRDLTFCRFRGGGGTDAAMSRLCPANLQTPILTITEGNATRTIEEAEKSHVRMRIVPLLDDTYFLRFKQSRTCEDSQYA